MRETVDLRDILGEDFKYFSIWEVPRGFKSVNEKIVYVDSEKGATDREIILQRIEDKKCFKLEATTWQTSNHDVNPIMIEVFPKQITTTVYE